MNNLPAFNQTVHGFENIGIPAGAPGTGWVYEVPIGLIISPTAIAFSLDTDSASATRAIELSIIAGGANVYIFRSPTIVDDDIVAAITCIAPGDRYHSLTAPESIIFPLPQNLFLVHPDQIAFVIYAPAAADVCQAIMMQARTWIIPA